jgi:predicted thioredoxin/glutaredoxin
LAADAEAEAQLDRTAQVEKFMRDVKWVQHFLPTLTQELYTSLSPIADFGKQSPQFLQTIQDVFNIVFPTVSFVLRPDDKIVAEVCTRSICYYFINIVAPQACKRMRTRRSLIAKGVLDRVQKIFAQEPYCDNPKLIRSFAVSALQPDGAAYYARPRAEGNENEVDD